jgi:phage/plasmid-like protein (TIGR03299 family)
MAHEIESLMYVGATPWHSLGVKLDAPPTATEAIKLAGLDWSVGLKALQTVDGAIPVDHKATYRLSDGRILGVVGPQYHPIQNSEAFDWFNPFLESGEASIETAGSLRDGQRVWVLAKLNRSPSVIVPGDEVQKFILLANSHDGTFTGRVGFTPIRVVCANTLSMATEEGTSQLLRVRHTKGAKKALDKIREIMNLANASFEATAAQYRQLAAHQVEPGDLEKYVKLVFKPVQTAKEKAHEAALNAAGPIGDNPSNDEWAAAWASARAAAEAWAEAWAAAWAARAEAAAWAAAWASARAEAWAEAAAWAAAWASARAEAWAAAWAARDRMNTAILDAIEVAVTAREGSS